jgi:hypothetical protein
VKTLAKPGERAESVDNVIGLPTPPVEAPPAAQPAPDPSDELHHYAPEPIAPELTYAEVSPRLKDMGHSELVIRLWQDAAKARQPQPEPTGPRWWEEPDAVRPPYYAKGGRFILVTSAASYVYVTPSTAVGDWYELRDAWGRVEVISYDAAAEFHGWMRTLRTNGVPRGWEPAKASEEELELRQQFGHAPALLRRMRERLQLPEPPTRLEGQLFDPGMIYSDTLLSSKFHIIDPGPYLVRHLLGDHGAHGRHGDVTLTALDRACPAAALVPSRNALAISSGVGLVASQYDVRVDGVGVVSILVRTLLTDAAVTGIGYGF